MSDTHTPGHHPHHDRRDPGFHVRELTAADIPEARALMLRTVAEDFGDPYDPIVHADVDDMAGWYLTPRGPFVLVAADPTTGALLATAGIRGGALKEGLSPPHLVERYRDGRTGQLVRVYVLREHRRRGIARILIDEVLGRARREAHYRTIALHTFPHSPGALPFWRSMGAEVVEDDTEGISRALFMEIPTSRNEEPRHEQKA
ncbi:GNAT family N-acetyltransferase [Streptomyces radicis]|uniref:GNAT family N-acetyltransferase n=1 Tax=Streptomyces radicis TaxID=1750517 RepID=A0A3A9WJR5_9ACTN|nr:GNAT family N-acetyltransferase [Streptomyces radicis]RKN12842.1 GNAT family N-acetyltransferase [Streptomyces radicis]RKN27393.1 GNAT family N-acetyltransferase [Streptomyces radicis]